MSSSSNTRTPPQYIVLFPASENENTVSGKVYKSALKSLLSSKRKTDVVLSGKYRPRKLMAGDLFGFVTRTDDGDQIAEIFDVESSRDDGANNNVVTIYRNSDDDERLIFLDDAVPCLQAIGGVEIKLPLRAVRKFRIVKQLQYADPKQGVYYKSCSQDEDSSSSCVCSDEDDSEFSDEMSESSSDMSEDELMDLVCDDSSIDASDSSSEEDNDEEDNYDEIMTRTPMKRISTRNTVRTPPRRNVFPSPIFAANDHRAVQRFCDVLEKDPFTQYLRAGNESESSFLTRTKDFCDNLFQTVVYTLAGTMSIAFLTMILSRSPPSPSYTFEFPPSLD